MDEQDENLGIVQFEYESQREKLNERPETVSRATGANSGCFILIGLLIGLGFLAAICLLLIIPS